MEMMSFFLAVRINKCRHGGSQIPRVFAPYGAFSSSRVITVNPLPNDSITPVINIHEYSQLCGFWVDYIIVDDN